MTRFEEWFLRRVFKREVRQGHDHDKRISAMYAMIREAAENEFTEDNTPTISDFLSECFARTQLWPFGKPAHCQCSACKDGVTHASDCAVHNMPAMANGDCNCDAAPQEDSQ